MVRQDEDVAEIVVDDVKTGPVPSWKDSLCRLSFVVLSLCLARSNEQKQPTVVMIDLHILSAIIFV